MSGDGGPLGFIPGTDADRACAIVELGRTAAGGKPQFDQRPGELEATRTETPLVCSQRTDLGWRVLLVANKHLTSQEARHLADELLQYADLNDGRVSF